MTSKKPRSIEGFTTLDELLDQDGTCEAFQAVAIKEVLEWQIEETMKGKACHATTGCGTVGPQSAA